MSIGNLPDKPNIVILLNDQDSAAQEWLPDFEKQHLPTDTRLKKNGLSFKNNFIGSCACSPARGVLLTGTYPTENGVAKTLGMPKDKTAGNPKAIGYTENNLKPIQTSIGHVLKTAGYHVVWKGKWHLSHPKDGTPIWTAEDIKYMKETYSLVGWNPSDSGDSKSDPRTLGGGRIYNNDARYVDGTSSTSDDALPAPPAESAVQFIENYQGTKPFCLIVSLVNPHDIWVAPNYNDGEEELTGYQREDGDQYHLPLPESINDDLAFKPEVQIIWRAMMQRGDREGIDISSDTQVQKNYVGFYAYLKTLVDKEMGKILDALEEKNLTNDTLIIRTSDHGELCLSHGLREKPYNAYDETIHVPLVFSNPKLFPQPQETEVLASAIDLLPTLAKIAGVYEQFSFAFRGRDLTPMLTNPGGTIDREYVHFAYDDGRLPDDLSDTPQLIRTIRSQKWKYSVYFSPDGKKFEYELYDLTQDPHEIYNIAGKDIKNKEKQIELHADLTKVMLDMRTLPLFLWFVSDEMENIDFIPEYSWPTEEEAWNQSRKQYEYNQVEQVLVAEAVKQQVEEQQVMKPQVMKPVVKQQVVKQVQTRVKRIESIISKLSPDELWWVRPSKLEKLK
ncbi:MAG: sulfatase-like hydrolase/transferase [Symploca sp. SIO3E6]|nr:sulfatase-like hydrolase/transferase [Caldora sp. SIO3E6]